MKISIQTKALKEALIKAKAIPGAVETIPLSGLVKIIADVGGTSFLRNTSMAFISVQSESEVEEEGETILDFSKLLGLAQNVAQETITLETTENGTKASYGKHFANFGKINEEGPQADHLEEEDRKELAFPAKEITQWGKDITIAMDQNPARVANHGLILQTCGVTTYAIATDGRRIHAAVTHVKEPIDVLIPFEISNAIKAIVGGEEEDTQITLGFGEGAIHLTTPTVQLRAKKVETNPPMLAKVFGETGFHTEFTVSPQDMLSALKSAIVFSEGEYKGVNLEISPKLLEIKTNNAQAEDSTHKVPIHGKAKVKDKAHSFKCGCQYLMDAMGVHAKKEKVTLRITDKNAMYIIEEDSVIAIMRMLAA